jgi:hypothetical protein
MLMMLRMLMMLMMLMTVSGNGLFNSIKRALIPCGLGVVAGLGVLESSF